MVLECIVSLGFKKFAKIYMNDGKSAKTLAVFLFVLLGYMCWVAWLIFKPMFLCM